MTFDIKSITPTRSDKPPRVVVYGPHKVGKSTFASMAPNPVYIDTEGGLENINANAFPVAHEWQQVIDALGSLYKDQHDYKTVVLDSLDWAERLAHKRVAEDNEVSGIEKIGYGKGYVFSADLFSQLFKGLDALRNDKGMGIILLCHAEIRRFDDPLADAYDRYQIKVHKLVGKLALEWADIIGFAQEESITKHEKKDNFDQSGRNRAIGTGRRVLKLGMSAAYDAGNRYGLPDSIDLNWAAFADALAAARGQKDG